MACFGVLLAVTVVGCCALCWRFCCLFIGLATGSCGWFGVLMLAIGFGWFSCLLWWLVGVLFCCALV